MNDGQLVRVLRAEFRARHRQLRGHRRAGRCWRPRWNARCWSGYERRPDANGARELTKADFQSSAETRWCPGCGDYAILAAVQGFLPELGIPPERTVFVSGIGCAGRFSYYMNTYGMHGIHGRAPAIATGLAATHARSLGVGRLRRRRRAVDRRQPPDPRAAPRRAGQDPAVQQPHLRADQGPGVADQRARQGHEVDAVRLDRRAVQPDLAGARRRRDVRRAHARHRQAAPARRCCAPPPRTPARR